MHKQVKKLNVFLWLTFTQTCKWDIALATIAMHFYSNKKGTNEISIRSNSDTYKDNNASYSQSVIWHILINWDDSGFYILIANHNMSPRRQIILKKITFTFNRFLWRNDKCTIKIRTHPDTNQRISILEGTILMNVNNWNREVHCWKNKWKVNWEWDGN